MNSDEAKLYLEHTGYDDFNLEEHQINNRLEAIKTILKENQQLKNRINYLQRELNDENLQCSKYAIDIQELKIQISAREEEYKKLKKQQQEFINYLNKTMEELECNDVDDEEMKGYLIQRICTFKEILEKYKEIIDKN